jgi:hypothetical protein
MGNLGEKCDLKNCSRWPKTEYVRTYISAFDRTRAGAWCVLSHAFELPQASSNACVQCSV